jgi:hypothetical protein
MQLGKQSTIGNMVRSQLSDWKRAHMCTENHVRTYTHVRTLASMAIHGIDWYLSWSSMLTTPTSFPVATVSACVSSHIPIKVYQGGTVDPRLGRRVTQRCVNLADSRTQGHFRPPPQNVALRGVMQAPGSSPSLHARRHCGGDSLPR